MKDFNKLLDQIVQIHDVLQMKAVHAINQSLTIRNSLIGYYIVEYEQNGNDRAKYGENLLVTLAKRLNIKGLSAPELSRCRQFYQCYPNILGLVSQEYTQLLPESNFGTVSQESKSKEFISLICKKLSYSHLIQLIKIKDHSKRTFYEIECIKGTWSVRELKRQISSLYYERSGMSYDPDKLSQITVEKTSPQKPVDIVKNIYAFEFLDIPNRDIVEESDLETALINHLQEFIIELGNGFCFEARQKKILIGSDYYFVDLVFYHRVLKCHVIIELKVGSFEHGDIGQLNTYLNFYKEEVAESNDNHPIGILLVADKDQTLVKYATAGLDEHIFVQQYLINLPSKIQLESYIDKALRKLL